MTLDDVVILSDQQVKGIYYDVYNGFWKRYSKAAPSWQSEEWDAIVRQARFLMERYHSCPLIVHQIQDLLDQLEARSRKGEK